MTSFQTMFSLFVPAQSRKHPHHQQKWARLLHPRANFSRALFDKMERCRDDDSWILVHLLALGGSGRPD